jgi:hypothetical protein
VTAVNFSARNAQPQATIALSSRVFLCVCIRTVPAPWAEDSRRGTHSLRPVGGLCLARERRFVAEVNRVVFDSHAAPIPQQQSQPACFSGFAISVHLSLAHGVWYTHNTKPDRKQHASFPPCTPTWRPG